MKRSPQSLRSRVPPRRRASVPTTRASVERPEPFSLFRVAAQLPLDSWGYQFSRDRPSLRLELLNRIELSGGLLLAEVRMIGVGADEWPEAARRLPIVVSVES